MKICIPIDKDDGLDSALSLHFGKAPMFIVVNMTTLETETFANSGPASRTDAALCRILAAEQNVTAVVVGGIGLDALSDLQSSGLAVYSSAKDTVKEIVEEVAAGDINPVTLGCSCKSGGGRGFGGAGCGGGFGGCRC